MNKPLPTATLLRLTPPSISLSTMALLTSSARFSCDLNGSNRFTHHGESILGIKPQRAPFLHEVSSCLKFVLAVAHDANVNQASVAGVKFVIESSRHTLVLALTVILDCGFQLHLFRP